MQPRRRTLQALIALGLFLAVVAGFGQTARAAPAIVVDLKSGEVLYAHRAHDRWYPASVTKLMTTYLAFIAMREGRLTPNSPVLMSKYALSKPPSKMGFPVGTRITLSSALKMLIVKSANDVSVAVAETVSGSEGAFVAEMNRTARQLGMSGTRFANPHGLHDAGQYTTARDMAVLARAILREFPQYRSLFSIQAIKVGRKTLRSHNRLIGRYPGATGMKTGYICAGGYNLVASAKRGNRHLIAVVLGARNGTRRALTAAMALENAFEGARGFRGNGANVESFRGSGRSPVNMRPHLCRSRSNRVPIPADIASFGFDVPSPVAREQRQQRQQQASGNFDPVGGRGAAAIVVNSNRRSSRGERIAAIIAGPRAAFTPVSANSRLEADPLATMSLPTSVPLPRRRPIIASVNEQPMVAGAGAPPAGVTEGGVPMPRARPAR